MPRPKRCRCVAVVPGQTVFKPAGVPAKQLHEVVLSVDEFESLRLADDLGLYQEQAAQQMRVSRQTFSRIVEAARQKIARALVNGWAIRIEGGPITMVETRHFQCAQCGHKWDVPFGTARPTECPSCRSADVHRAVDAPGQGSGGRGRCRRVGGVGGGMNRGRRRCARGRALIDGAQTE